MVSHYHQLGMDASQVDQGLSNLAKTIKMRLDFSFLLQPQLTEPVA